MSAGSHEQDRMGSFDYAYQNNGVFEYLLYLYVVLIWMPGFTTIGSTVLGISAFLLVLLAPFIGVRNYSIRLDRVSSHYSRWILILIFLLLSWGAIGMFRVEDHLRAGRFFLSYGQGFVLIALFTRVASVQCIVNCFRLSVFMFLATFAVELASTAEVLPKDLMYQGTDRLIGFFKNSNQHGMILSMVSCVAISFLLYSKVTLLKVVVALSCYAALLLAGSKTNIAIAVLLSVLIVSYTMLSKRRFLTYLFVMPLLIVIVFALGLPILEYVNPRAAGILYDFLSGEGSQNNSVYQRSFLWVRSIEVMRDSPFFGQGPGQRVVIFDQDHSHSHNVVLDTGRTLGVPGIVILVLIICLIVFHTVQTFLAVASGVQLGVAEGSQKALVVGCSFASISYILSNQMSDSFGPSTSVFLWLTVGVMLRRNDLMFATSTT